MRTSFDNGRHVTCLSCTPIVYCSSIVIYHGTKLFYRAMDKSSDLKLDHQDEVVEPFLYGLREHPIPTPGVDTVLSVVPKGVDDAGQVGVCKGEEGERERNRVTLQVGGDYVLYLHASIRY